MTESLEEINTIEQEPRTWRDAISGYVLDGLPFEKTEIVGYGKNPGVLQRHLDDVKSSGEYLENQPESRRRLQKLTSFIVRATEIHIENARYYPASSIPHRGAVGSQMMKSVPSPQE